MTPITYREAYGWAFSFLEKQHTKSPAFEAELLLRKSAGIERHQLFMQWDELVDDEAWEQYQRWIERRGDHVPVQYLTKEQEFYGHMFYVDERVLIPRPETEFLVEQALKRLQDKVISNSNNSISSNSNCNETISILDIGTGSGAIAITVALEMENYYKKIGSQNVQSQIINIDALDISADALAVAMINGTNLLKGEGTQTVNVWWLQGDTWPQEQACSHSYHMILSNPPYIDWAEELIMDREVKDYEPKMALFAADNGLAIYKKIISESSQYLHQDGWIGFEMGYQQADQIQQLLLDKGFGNIEITKDLAGHRRVIFAQRGVG